LAKKIDKYTRSGLAVDRIRELIQTGSDYEQAVEKCNLMIDAMQLTDKEKSVLKSIVTQKRKGVLEVTDKQKRKKIAQISIPPKNFQELTESEKSIALYLIANLNKYIKQPLEISFVTD
jgi:hypothetical protein